MHVRACVRACDFVTHEASQVLPDLPDKEGSCLLCVCFLYVVVFVWCVWWFVSAHSVCVRVHVV